MNSLLIRKEMKFRIIYLVIFIMLSLLSLWGGYAGVNYNFLNESNSVKIKTIDFSPNFSVHRISEEEIGMQKYIYNFSGEKINSLQGEEFKIIVSKLSDNAIKIRLNGRLLSSEGDFKYGRSMFKNAHVHASFEKKEIIKDNIIEIETYALYKSGIESGHIIIAKSDVAMKIIRLLDFHGSKMILLSLGFLIFSGIFTLYVYGASEEKDIALIYSAIATFALSIYFIDYIKMVDIAVDYFILKKIFILGLNIGILFYTLTIRSFVKIKKLLWCIIALFIYYIFIMTYSNNLVEFKTLYEYWYYGLIANIFLFLIFFIRNFRNNSRIHIFLISFILLASYTSFVLIAEFRHGFFSLNSPLMYISILGTLPLLIGFDAIQDKERKIIIEQKEKERVFLTSLEDSLTGAWNKRYFDIKIDKISNGDTLAMIDFDDFKKVNDSYGHGAGDYILKGVSTLILKSIRKEDDLCRIGGDEFVIVFSSCDQNNALRIMKEVQERLSREDFYYDHHHIKQTVSIGICQVEENMTKKLLLKKLDESLYEAKHSGKNTIK